LHRLMELITKLSGLPTSLDDGDYIGRSPQATEDRISLPTSLKHCSAMIR
jgi:hypothetical protein